MPGMSIRKDLDQAFAILSLQTFLTRMVVLVPNPLDVGRKSARQGSQMVALAPNPLDRDRKLSLWHHICSTRVANPLDGGRKYLCWRVWALKDDRIHSAGIANVNFGTKSAAQVSQIVILACF